MPIPAHEEREPPVPQLLGTAGPLALGRSRATRSERQIAPALSPAAVPMLVLDLAFSPPRAERRVFDGPRSPQPLARWRRGWLSWFLSRDPVVASRSAPLAVGCRLSGGHGVRRPAPSPDVFAQLSASRPTGCSVLSVSAPRNPCWEAERLAGQWWRARGAAAGRSPADAAPAGGGPRASMPPPLTVLFASTIPCCSRNHDSFASRRFFFCPSPARQPVVASAIAPRRRHLAVFLHGPGFCGHRGQAVS